MTHYLTCQLGCKTKPLISKGVVSVCVFVCVCGNVCACVNFLVVTDFSSAGAGLKHKLDLPTSGV